MSLRQSVKKSLMDYQDARVRRREMLGLMRVDALSDISNLIDATKERVSGESACGISWIWMSVLKTLSEHPFPYRRCWDSLRESASATSRGCEAVKFPVAQTKFCGKSACW